MSADTVITSGSSPSPNPAPIPLPIDLSNVLTASTAHAASAETAKNATIALKNDVTALSSGILTARDETSAARDVALTSNTTAMTATAADRTQTGLDRSAVNTAKTDTLAAKDLAVSAKDTAVAASGVAVSAKDTAVAASGVAVSAKDTAVAAAAQATAGQIQTNWNATSGVASIANKPTLGTAAALNVDVANGVAGLAGDGKVPAARVNVTKSDIGLGNVDNTSDANKPIATSQAAVNASVQSQLSALTGAARAIARRLALAL